MGKLNGWQRIGIVLSLMWIIGAIYLAFGDECKNVFDKFDRPPTSNLSCYTNKEIADAAGIKLEPGIDPNGLGRPSVIKSVLLNSVPVPIAWLSIYAIVWIFCWIKTGFRNKNNG